MEVDDDVDIVLGAVNLDSAILCRGFLELGDFGGTGIAQFIRVLVQGVPVQPMGQSISVILRQDLLHERKGILFEIVDGGCLTARRYQ